MPGWGVMIKAVTALSGLTAETKTRRLIRSPRHVRYHVIAKLNIETERFEAVWNYYNDIIFLFPGRFCPLPILSLCE